MKKIALVLCTSFALTVGRAQTFSEWFRQKKTQIEYLINQIAAYKVYIDDLEKGYHIASDGLATIEKFKHGEFDLHDLFFASLRKVKAPVAGNSKANEIVRLIAAMQHDFSSVLSLPNFDEHEKMYLRQVQQQMSANANASLDELNELSEDDVFQMTDNERITRIDAIYKKTTDEYQFVQSLAVDAAMICQQRNLNP